MAEELDVLQLAKDFAFYKALWMRFDLYPIVR